MEFEGIWSFEVHDQTNFVVEKKVQTIPLKGIRLKEYEGIWSFFRCMRGVLR